MEMRKSRHLGDVILGFFLLSHPGPVCLHLLAVTIFTLIAAWPVFSWSTIALVIAAHAAMQLSIAFLNDYCDQRLDGAGKREKPIVRGLVRPREAFIAGAGMSVLMLALLLRINAAALLISLAYWLLGQGYNFGLKATAWSGVVFALALPLIPIYAFVALGRFPPLLFWLAPVGFLLGVALNVANALPDLEQDAAHGARTLAVKLGVQRAYVLCPLALALAAALVGCLALTRLVPAQPWILLATVLLSCVAVGAMLLFWSPGSARRGQGRTSYFYLVAFTCLLLAAGWLIGVLA